ncbi:hypothetical protein ATANTOWER_029335 [Ataeniobius toweri]|uniref:NADH dehydrogenase subunit 6 n=1 Tax=Ataeniobius toweri TaxID=208326 RepID=A0ABU7BUZ3_9TELE|nr:hypothetical protein [Ataeniobius toweri]
MPLWFWVHAFSGTRPWPGGLRDIGGLSGPLNWRVGTISLHVLSPLKSAFCWWGGGSVGGVGAKSTWVSNVLCVLGAVRMLGWVYVSFWGGGGWLALGGHRHHLDLGGSGCDSGSLSWGSEAFSLCTVVGRVMRRGGFFIAWLALVVLVCLSMGGCMCLCWPGACMWLGLPFWVGCGLLAALVLVWDVLGECESH